MSPISPERKKLYPKNWDRISLLIREKSGWRCELCRTAEGMEIRTSGQYVVLTVHHINGDPTDNRKCNLIALCQRCHLRLDQPFKRERRALKAAFSGGRIVFQETPEARP